MSFVDICVTPANAITISTRHDAEVNVRCDKHKDGVAQMQTVVKVQDKLLSTAPLTMAQHCAQRAGKAEEAKPSSLEGVR